MVGEYGVSVSLGVGELLGVVLGLIGNFGIFKTSVDLVDVTVHIF